MPGKFRNVVLKKDGYQTDREKNNFTYSQGRKNILRTTKRRKARWNSDTSG